MLKELAEISVEKNIIKLQAMTTQNVATWRDLSKCPVWMQLYKTTALRATWLWEKEQVRQFEQKAWVNICDCPFYFWTHGRNVFLYSICKELRIKSDLDKVIKNFFSQWIVNGINNCNGRLPRKEEDWAILHHLSLQGLVISECWCFYQSWSVRVK